MSDSQRDAGRLQADLAQLRVALRALEAPPVDEAALRARFRAIARQREQAAATAPRATGSWRMHAAAAAVVVLAIAAALAAVLLRVERTQDAPLVADAPKMQPLAASAFQPLLNAPGLSPSLSYSVVRVRIPLSALALVPGTQENGTIEADLLVGEDGLARGIRFAGADTMLVSVAAQ
jgi:hypothetical protein